MASEVESQKNRLKISSSNSNSNKDNNRQANSQKQLTSNRGNMENNQKTQVASLRQSLLASSPPLSLPPSSSSTTSKQHENSPSQLNHESQSFSSAHSPDFTLAVTASRSQDQSDSTQSPKFQEKEQHQIDQDEEQGKHHVGPVMGIFFKVWSLVKGKLDKMKVRE